jgi:prepilin-type processing-associated H-X9-DG protein
MGVNLGYLDGHVDNLLPVELNPLSSQWEILGMTGHGNHGGDGPTLTPSTQSWNKLGNTYTVNGEDLIDNSGSVHVPQ